MQGELGNGISNTVSVMDAWRMLYIREASAHELHVRHCGFDQERNKATTNIGDSKHGGRVEILRLPIVVGNV